TVNQLDRLAIAQLIACLAGVERDPDEAAMVDQPEGYPGDRVRQARPEGERVEVVPQTTESRHHGEAGTRHRGEMDVVVGVSREIPEIDERRLPQVVVGQVEVTDLGGDDRLDRRRQGGVPDGDRLVVVEVTSL